MTGEWSRARRVHFQMVRDVACITVPARNDRALAIIYPLGG